jgi:IclR family KDG regulon transcriptional repressor
MEWLDSRQTEYTIAPRSSSRTFCFIRWNNEGGSVSNSYIVQPVYKALQVLRVLGDERRELALSEICYRVDMPKTTVFRYLQTLCACGFVTHDPDTDLYRIGLRVWELGQTVHEPLRVRDLALPAMRELRDQFNETVNLGVLDGLDVVYIEIIESRRSLRMQAQLGGRDPVYSTALGKAVLAFMPEPQWAAHIPPSLAPRTERTVTSLSRLQQALALTREHGFALDDEENEEGARCIAAPIFNHQSVPLAAVSLSAPANRLTNRLLPKVAAAVTHTAAAISQRFGHR